jgi:hypothetical protein
VEVLASLFVGQPRNIALVAGALFVMHGAAQWSGRRSRALLVAAAAWAVYSGWEWLVQARTPGANIRADLLLIWPVLGIITLVAAVRALR